MNAAFVLDSSVALAWCFKDQETHATLDLLMRMRHDTVAVPAWWYIETGNVLALAHRRARLSSQQLEAVIAMMRTFDLLIDDTAPSRAWEHLIPLANQNSLTVYDAMYLDLAQRLAIPLATLDTDLRAAATRSGVALLGI